MRYRPRPRWASMRRISEHAFNAYRLDQFIISRFYSVLLLSTGSRQCPNHAIGPYTLNFYLYFAFIAIMSRYYQYLLAAQVEHTCLQYSREDFNNFWKRVYSERTRGLVIIDKMLKAFFPRYYKIWKRCSYIECVELIWELDSARNRISLMKFCM